MRKAAVTANLLKPSSRYYQLHGHEVDVLDALPLWVTRLFFALVRISDFKTGAGCTSYAQLVASLTPIQPRSGPREFVPTERAVRDAVVKLEARRILARDKARSQAENLLFFMVCSRGAQVRPKGKLRPLTPTPVDSRKASTGAGSSPKA